jgi:hypothetical protein
MRTTAVFGLCLLATMLSVTEAQGTPQVCANPVQSPVWDAFEEVTLSENSYTVKPRWERLPDSMIVTDLIGRYSLAVIRTHPPGIDSVRTGRLTLQLKPSEYDSLQPAPVVGTITIDLSELGATAQRYSPSQDDPVEPGVALYLWDGSPFMVVGGASTTRLRRVHGGISFYIMQATDITLRGRWRDGGLAMTPVQGFFCAQRQEP